MENEKASTYMPTEKKKIQAAVVVGYGEKQELVVNLATVSPPSPPVFRIKDIDKIVEIFDWKVVPLEGKKDGAWMAKVIMDGYIDKNINYKTITDWDDKAVNGPVYQFTLRVYFNTFVEVCLTEPICEKDNLDVTFLETYVEGEKDELLCPNPPLECAPDWAITYNQILEKMIVKIKIKLTKTEDFHVAVDC